jgi:SNF2 family DNA or RNA helicase
MDISWSKNFRISLRTKNFHPKYPVLIGEVVGRVWDRDKKVWTIPISSVELLARKLLREGIWSERDVETVRNAISKILDFHNTDISLVEKNINLPLRPYQRESLMFFKNRGSALGALDMALGKSFLALAYLFDLRQSGKVDKALILVPVSATWHWYREAKKFFSDKLKLCVIGYSVDEKGKIKKLSKEDRIKQLKSKEYDGYLLNYEKLKDIVDMVPEVVNDKPTNRTKSIIQLKEWDKPNKFLVIGDEITRIKSWSAKRTKLMKALPATYRIGLSGRPIENNITELYTILDWIWPGCLGSWGKFQERFGTTNKFGKITSVKDQNTLKEIVDYIAIKFSRYEVLKDLPPIIRNQYDIEFTDQEERDYALISNKIEDAITLLGQADSRTGMINVLALLQFSRMYCDHPILLRLSESKTAKSLNITSGHSSKFEEFKIILDEILNLREKVVVFSQFRRMIELIEADIIKKYHFIKVYKMVGGLSSLKKQQLIDDFTKDPNPAVFLATDTGAYAIELQCASYIINYDIHWNPAVLEQRISRLHRPGQQKPVNVINLVVSGPDMVEQHVLDVVKKKNQLYKDIMGDETGEQPNNMATNEAGELP